MQRDDSVSVSGGSAEIDNQEIQTVAPSDLEEVLDLVAQRSIALLDLVSIRGPYSYPYEPKLNVKARRRLEQSERALEALGLLRRKK